MGKVFISYSHDSRDHLDRVLTLSNRLRREGVDCHIDQYQDSPPEGWPTWCANQVEEAEFVLVVCTATYELRFRGKEQPGKGLGVTWEGFVITQQLYEAQGSNAKFIPVLLASEDSAHIPLTLRGATRYDISNEDGYDALYRRVTHQPSVIMPQLGEIRQRSQRVVKQALATLPRKQTFHETSVGTYAAIALIAVIFAIGFTIFYKNGTQETFDLTVRAHNTDGSVPIIAAGTVTMDLDNDRRTEPFRENGEADFKGVPSKFFGSKIKVLARVEGYEEKWEVHKITSGSLDLALQAAPQITFQGFVQDEYGNPLPNVKVLSPDCNQQLLTGENGTFTSQIRPSISPCHLVFTKDGYESYNTDVSIGEATSHKFSLRRKKK